MDIVVTAVITFAVTVAVALAVAPVLLRDQRDDQLLGVVVDELGAAKQSFKVTSLDTQEVAASYRAGWRHIAKAKAAAYQLSTYWAPIREWVDELEDEPDEAGRAALAYFLNPKAAGLPPELEKTIDTTKVDLARPGGETWTYLVVFTDMIAVLRREGTHPAKRFRRWLRRLNPRSRAAVSNPTPPESAVDETRDTPPNQSAQGPNSG